jgi:hypothetical protein
MGLVMLGAIEKLQGPKTQKKAEADLKKIQPLVISKSLV